MSLITQVIVAELTLRQFGEGFEINKVWFEDRLRPGRVRNRDIIAGRNRLSPLSFPPSPHAHVHRRTFIVLQPQGGGCAAGTYASAVDEPAAAVAHLLAAVETASDPATRRAAIIQVPYEPSSHVLHVMHVPPRSCKCPPSGRNPPWNRHRIICGLLSRSARVRFSP